MMKKPDAFFLIGLLASAMLVSSCQSKSVPATLRNESAITATGPGEPPVGNGHGGVWTTCTGRIDGLEDELAAIRVSTKTLAAGTPCAAGDFDGNGFMDVAIWGLRAGPDEWPDFQNYRVVFFDGPRVLRTVPLKTAVGGFSLVTYPPRASAGPHGEPASATDALLSGGMTQGYDDLTKGDVFIFDRVTGIFIKRSFGAPSTLK